MNEIKKILKRQKSFFDSGLTKNLKFRQQQLRRLRTSILSNERKIARALKLDLNKSYFESYSSEIGIVLSEIRYMERHLKDFARPESVKTPMAHFYSKSKIYKEPYGTVLIVSPWNYPFQLSMMPLIAAIAAGNCAIIKPAYESFYTSKVICEIISECFEEEFVCVVEGGIEESRRLLEQKFDFIFFTGSVGVGKIVMQKASENLIPVALELGGKSPCVVDETADLKLAAKRIVWGKFLNAGQTCVAPDYILVSKKVKEELINYLISYIKKFYGSQPLRNKYYPKIIHKKHLKRLVSLKKYGRVRTGGRCNTETNQMEPTILDQVQKNSPLMRNEIFGPLLPVLEYDKLDEAMGFIKQKPKPLALYIFSKSKRNIETLTKNISYGGGCINDTIVHLASSYLPFGGVGESGIGRYHGKSGFETFSHNKSIMEKSNLFDVPFRYPNHKDHLWVLKMFLH